MQRKGLYSIVRKHENGVDYEVEVNPVKLYNIIMLKKYVRRDDISSP